MQARTYLFCAIRPECKYHPYTFSTLGKRQCDQVVPEKSVRGRKSCREKNDGGACEDARNDGQIDQREQKS